MNYIKAKYPNSNRLYTYRTEDVVSAGDIVVTEKGAKLTVIDEPVNAAWIMAYGADKVAIVKKYDELKRKVDVDILDKDTKCKFCTYNSDCSKQVTNSGGEPCFPFCTEHKPDEWFNEEEYLNSLKESEEK